MDSRATRRGGDDSEDDDETVWGLLCQAEKKIQRAKELYRGRNAALIAALTEMPVSFDDPPAAPVPAPASVPAMPTATPETAPAAPVTAPAAIAPRSRARR